MHKESRATSLGFTLIEIMIAVVILATGLLGMATLITISLKSSESAYSRAQATLLAYDIVDRMRANQVFDSSNPYQAFKVSHASISNDYILNSPTDCPPAGAGDASASGSEKAAADLSAWCQQLTNSLPSLLRTTSISRNGSSYTISINWSEPDNQNSNIVLETELQ